MIKVGVVGFGYWGPNLVRNFQSLPECRVSAVASLDSERLKLLKDRFPDVRVYDDARAMFHDPEVDAVAIATPVSTHFGLARDALLNGKHVLVEKPLARYSVEALRLVELAEAQRRVLMAGHTWLYSNAVRTIRDIVTNGELGDIWYYHSIRANLGLIRTDVNVLYDLAPHDLSILTFLFPEQPQRIWTIGSCRIANGGGPQESFVSLTLDWPSGTMAHVDLNWLSPVKTRCITIAGTRRMLVYDPLVRPEIEVYDRGVDPGDPVRYRHGNAVPVPVDELEPLAVECEHFLQCIKYQMEPISGGLQGLRVVQLLEAAQNSLALDGTVVRFTDDYSLCRPDAAVPAD